MTLTKRLTALRPGAIATIAGAGYHEGIPAKEADGAPAAVRFDGDGNLYFSDSAYHVVRRVDGQGMI